MKSALECIPCFVSQALNVARLTTSDVQVHDRVMREVEAFFAEVERAPDILFIADNAGELVFDRLLLELLPREKVTVVVKGGPAINDALRADATAAGLDGLVEVTDTGSDGAGIVLESCSPELSAIRSGAWSCTATCRRRRTASPPRGPARRENRIQTRITVYERCRTRSQQ
jgi:uncharacterized protein with ATP-grasp and redox domains